MKRIATWLPVTVAGLFLFSGAAFPADTTGGRSPAAATQPKTAPKPVPAPAAASPNVKIPPCGVETPPAPSRSGATASAKDATTLQVGHSVGAIGAKAVLRAKLTRSKDGAAVREHTVNFSVAGKSAGSAKTDNQGEAKVPYIVPAQMGNQDIGASYRGSDFCAPSSGKNTLGVVKSATKFTLKRLNEHRTLREGEGDSLEGKLYRITDEKGLDGREVQLTLDGKKLGNAATNPQGGFSQHFSMPPPSKGTHTIEARYETEPLYLGTAGTYKFEVLPKIQDAYLTWTGASGKVGQTVTVTAKFGLGNPPSAKNAIAGKKIDFRSYGIGSNNNYVKVLGESVTNSQGVATVSFKIEDPAANYKMATQAHVSNLTDYDVKYLSDVKYTVAKAPVTLSIDGPGAAPIGSKVTFTTTVRRTTDNGPAAGVKVTMKFPTEALGKTATTDAGGKATFQTTVPYAYGTGTKTLSLNSEESKHYLAGKGVSKAFAIQPKTN